MVPHQVFMSSARRNYEIAHLVLRVNRLYKRVLDCRQQLAQLERHDKSRHHINDERFGYQIEMECLELRIKALKAEAQRELEAKAG